MRLHFIIAITLTLGFACATSRTNRKSDDIADFSLSQEPVGVKVDDREYFKDLQRSEAAVRFESSFPLPLSVAKAVDPYDVAPAQGNPPVDSKLSFQLGSCRLLLRTGPIQVDRFLLAGQWIKLSEGLPARIPVKLEAQMDLNLKIITELVAEIPESQKAACRKLLEGKRVVLGNFHLNKSRIGLFPAPKAPQVFFTSRSMDPKGKRVSLRWAQGANEPVLLDDFDFPATCESGIFRAVMSSKGFYYLVFQTVLRMDGHDQMVIRIPYPSVPASPSKKALEKVQAKPGKRPGM